MREWAWRARSWLAMDQNRDEEFVIGTDIKLAGMIPRLLT